ncbi:hypothetical protein BDQ17DRAFT_842388 [Cyathus striatus]|nr:hypothetical protein BDQ17DRAFT_842388 [Cyathus striatus]
MLDAIRPMDCIDELHVGAEVRGGDTFLPDQGLLAFIRSLWETVVGSNLKSLHLISNTAVIDHFLPYQQKFPALRAFSLTLVGHPTQICRSFDRKATENIIVQFLGEHSSQIRTLKFSFKDNSEDINTRRMFIRLSHFLVLEEFYFLLGKDYERNPSVLGGLIHFVTKQSTSLTSLKLMFPRMSVQGSLAEYHILTSSLSDNMAFLRLQKLQLRTEMISFRRPETLEVLQSVLSRCQESMEELTLKDVVAINTPADQLSIIRNIFGQTVPRLTL